MKKRELRAAGGVGFHASVTDREMRDWLESELADAEPGAKWIWVTDVDQSEGYVIYEMSTEEDPERTYRRAFTVDGDSLELSLDKEEVRQQVSYVPASENSQVVYNTTNDGDDAEEPMPTASTASTCQCKKKGKPMADNTQDAVDRLIASSASPFTEETREAVKSFDAATLKSLCSRYLSEEVDVSEEPAEPAPAAATPKPAEDAEEAPAPVAAKADIPEWMRSMSKDEMEDMRAAASAHKAEQKRQKDALVASLKGAQDAFTETQLQAKPVDELRALMRLCKVDEPRGPVDVSGRGLGRRPDGESDIYMNPPDPWALAIAKRDGTAQAGGNN